MRSIIIYMLTVLSLCAYELSVKKEFSRLLQPDSMSTSFELSMRDKKSSAIQEAFNEMALGMKEHAHCSGGAYTIEPLYDYKKSERTFLGYAGRMAFICKFKSIEEIEKVYELLGSDKNIELRQNPIVWVVDDKHLHAAKEALEFEAIKYADKYIGMMRKEAVSTCKLKKIDISNNVYTQPRTMRALAAQSVPFEPTKEPVKINISAHYSFECDR